MSSSNSYRNGSLSPGSNSAQFRPNNSASGKHVKRGGNNNGWYMIYGLILIVVFYVAMTYYTHSLLTSNHQEELSLSNNAFVVNNLRIPVTMREVENKLISKFQQGKDFIMKEEEALLNSRFMKPLEDTFQNIHIPNPLHYNLHSNNDIAEDHSIAKIKEQSSETLSHQSINNSPPIVDSAVNHDAVHESAGGKKVPPVVNLSKPETPVEKPAVIENHNSLPQQSSAAHDAKPVVPVVPSVPVVAAPVTVENHNVPPGGTHDTTAVKTTPENHNVPPVQHHDSTTTQKDNHLEHNTNPNKKNDKHKLLVSEQAEMKTIIKQHHHTLDCPFDDVVTFWDEPSVSDLTYESPYVKYGPQEKYVTFEPDVGGWNNIRMQMELVLVFAYATGRTLVLPPDQPMYLLDAGKGHQKAHSFIDFFPFDHINKRMKVITMEEFMEKEGITGHMTRYNSDGKVTNEIMYPPGNKTVFIGTVRDDRLSMWYYLRNVSACPAWKSMEEFVVIPPGPNINVTTKYPPKIAAKYHETLTKFASKRKPVYYDEYWQQQKFVHFISKPELGFRLLEHFYTFIYFEDEYMDKYYKRFIRDYVHYIDTIFCKSAKIIHQLQLLGNGSYVSFHIRRGEFQYKVVKIPAEKILENVGQFLPKKTIAFVATDEKNKTFFNAFEERFTKVYYLNDFIELAELKGINPNYLGMIDQVVCTRGEKFVGTWFSTFTGYITRMRGYMGYPSNTVYFGDKEHRDRYQKPEQPKFPFYMREWETSWENIDEVEKKDN